MEVHHTSSRPAGWGTCTPSISLTTTEKYGYITSDQQFWVAVESHRVLCGS
jgi:hypothetical protein